MVETQNNPQEEAYNIDPEFKSSRKINSPDGWLSPVGLFYGCTDEEHDVSAEFICQKHKTNIEYRLEQAHLKLKDVDGNDIYPQSLDEYLTELTPRMILKHAGYALISGGIMAQTNAPEAYTSKQIALLERAQIPFSPESITLDQATREEYRNLISHQDGYSEFLKDFKRGLSKKDKAKFESFLYRLDSFFGLLNGSYEIGKLFEILTPDFDSEIVNRKHRNTYTWRRVPLKSGKHVYIQHHYHEHAYDDESWVSIVRDEDIKNFVDNTSSQSSKK